MAGVLAGCRTPGDVLRVIERFDVPSSSFAPVVTDQEGLVDADAVRESIQAAAEALGGVRALLPFPSRGEGDGDACDGSGSVDGDNKGARERIAAICLKYCIDDGAEWRPTWTGPDASRAAMDALAGLVEDSGTAHREGSGLESLTAALCVALPRLQDVIMLDHRDRLTNAGGRRASIFANADDATVPSASADLGCALTTELYALHLVLQAMPAQRFLDANFALPEAAIPALVHALHSTLQPLQYLGLLCLSRLVRVSPPTVLSWHKDDLYACLSTFIGHEDVIVWRAAVDASVATHVAIEGRNPKSDRLLDLAEALVEQAERMDPHPIPSHRRFPAWCDAMTTLLPSLGITACAFLKRIIAIVGEQTSGGAQKAQAGQEGGGEAAVRVLEFVAVLLEVCRPRIQTYRTQLRGLVDALAEANPGERKRIKALDELMHKGTVASNFIGSF